MATIQSQMISGRYRSEALCSHWSSNKSGYCQLSNECSSILEDIPHILAICTKLQPTRNKLWKFTIEYCDRVPNIKQLVHLLCSNSSTSTTMFCQFLLDCSSMPEVIAAVQNDGDEILHHLFHISRTWVYTLHRERMKRLGRWNPL